ncbi:hypothetical protein FJZ36_10945 [Candidatus Poribacteria bacterium]|nr:hypothetical protein [Candidatus Poribacteria bacterium]
MDITGQKALRQIVEEYSNLLGDVVLGMDRSISDLTEKIESALRVLDKKSDRLESLIGEARSLLSTTQGDVEKMRAAMSRMEQDATRFATLVDSTRFTRNERLIYVAMAVAVLSLIVSVAQIIVR